MKQDTLAALPPVSVSGWVVLGLPIADWIVVLTLMYTLMVVINQVPNFLARLREFRAWIKEKP